MRIGEIPNPLFREAANTPTLHAAYGALVGPGRWLPRGSLGTFPIRFPSTDDPGDCGWHVDTSFGAKGEPDFLEWRVNVASKGRALLMLFLFSDVGDDDAPTRLRVGSHLDIARRLEPSKPFEVTKILHEARAEFAKGFSARLSWTHYRGARSDRFRDEATRENRPQPLDSAQHPAGAPHARLALGPVVRPWSS